MYIKLQMHISLNIWWYTIYMHILTHKSKLFGKMTKLFSQYGTCSFGESSVQFSSVQLLSHIQLFETPWTAARQASLSITKEFTQTDVHRLGDAIQPSHPLSSPSPPAPDPSQHQSLFQSQLFAWGGQSIGVSASASVLPMNTQDWCFLILLHFLP